MRITLRTLRARVATARPLSAIEMTKSDSLSLSDAVTAWLDEPTVDVSVARPLAVAANVSDRVGSWMTPTVGPAVDDERDRYAEERDAVRVVHRAVERVDDPHPTAARGRRLAGDGMVLPALLGQDRVGRDRRLGWRRGSGPRRGDRPRSPRRGRSCSRCARAVRSGPSGSRRPGPRARRRRRGRPPDADRPSRASGTRRSSSDGTATELGHDRRERAGLARTDAPGWSRTRPNPCLVARPARSGTSSAGGLALVRDRDRDGQRVTLRS